MGDYAHTQPFGSAPKRSWLSEIGDSSLSLRMTNNTWKDKIRLRMMVARGCRNLKFAVKTVLIWFEKNFCYVKIL